MRVYLSKSKPRMDPQTYQANVPAKQVNSTANDTECHGSSDVKPAEKFPSTFENVLTACDDSAP